jgi:hypothetical protein
LKLLSLKHMIYLLDWFLQAAYKVGGYTVSADTIQNTILRCRMSRPGQVNSMILTTKKKDKIYYWNKILSTSDWHVTCWNLPPLVVATFVIFIEDKIQNRRRTTSICIGSSWASFTLCSLFRKPFWSRGILLIPILMQLSD